VDIDRTKILHLLEWKFFLAKNELNFIFAIVYYIKRSVHSYRIICKNIISQYFLQNIASKCSKFLLRGEEQEI